ncbi:MAG: hypothetical protein WC943_13360 [Elusimicrobiota bacterium]|jgi:hypothetical protein
MTPAGKKPDHYTRVFHELMEPLITIDLTGIELRIILWTARNSYGRKGAHFTQKPLSWRLIAKEIAADRRCVARKGAGLIERGILRLDTEGCLGIDKHRIRSLALGPQTPGSTDPGVYRPPREGSTDPGFSYNQEREKGPLSLPAPKNSFGPEQLLELWNQAADARLPRARELSPERRRFALARLKDHPEAAFWRDVLAMVNASAFLTGQNDRGWVADFDFILNPNKLPRIVEGKYGNGNGPRPAAEDGHAKMAAWKKRMEAA